MKKAVFFDLDGTLMDGTGKIPDSAKAAIRLLKENGICTFICTGRCSPFITNRELLSLPFDGIIAGCGTYVMCDNQVLFYKKVPVADVKKTVTVFAKYNIPLFLEGQKHYYLDESDEPGIPFLAALKHDVGENLVSIKDHEGNWEVSKFAAFACNDHTDDAIRELSDIYDICVHGGIMIEGVPKGCSKAAAIKMVCEKLGILQENTYAFGDSPNDAEMLQFVGHGIAMGNGMPEAKAAAEYVTSSLHEDGILNACKHYSLV